CSFSIRRKSRRQKRPHEIGHGTIKIALPPDDADISQLRFFLSRKMGKNTFAQGYCVFARTQKLDQRDERPVDNHVPASRGIKLRDIEPGFFLELSPQAVIKIDFVGDDVVGIWRAAGKIDSSRVECVRAHRGKQECTVRAAHCRGTEAVAYAGGWPAPIAPGGKARIVRFQILATQHALLNNLMMQQQDTPVPHCRLFASYRFEIGVDLGAPLGGEGPGLWRERKIQPADMKDRWRTNLNKVASIKL